MDASGCKCEYQFQQNQLGLSSHLFDTRSSKSSVSHYASISLSILGYGIFFNSVLWISDKNSDTCAMAEDDVFSFLFGVDVAKIWYSTVLYLDLSCKITWITMDLVQLMDYHNLANLRIRRLIVDCLHPTRK